MKFRARKAGGIWYAYHIGHGCLWAYDLPSLMGVIETYLASRLKPFPTTNR